MDGPTRKDYKGMVDYLKNEKRLRTKIFKQEMADLDRQIELFEKEADRKWPAPPHHAPKGEMETCVTYSAYTLEKLGLIDTEAKKKCHKPQSAYYRCYCDELEEEEYCNGCEFWYAEQKGE